VLEISVFMCQMNSATWNIVTVKVHHHHPPAQQAQPKER